MIHFDSIISRWKTIIKAVTEQTHCIILLTWQRTWYDWEIASRNADQSGAGNI
jgi:hypothetical protein